MPRYALYSIFMELDQTGPEVPSPPHLWDHPCSYGGLEGGGIENILCLIDFTCPNIYFVQFSWTYVKQDHRYPLRPIFGATLAPMRGRKVGRSKIYFAKSILHALIYIFSISMGLGKTGPDISSSAHLYGHSWS